MGYIIMMKHQSGGDPMNSMFEDLCEGLQEAIDYEKGNRDAKVRTFLVSPVKRYKKNEIRDLRISSGMTQAVFADLMGVSKKTVEAWECGRTHPTGAACRLMQILAEQGKEELPFVTMK